MLELPVSDWWQHLNPLSFLIIIHSYGYHKKNTVDFLERFRIVEVDKVLPIQDRGKGKMETQVVIIGGGLMGTALARELSRYKLDAVLVERYPDVCWGLSKASNGMIYSGLTWLVSVALKAIATEGGDAGSHMEKDRLCLEGYERWEAIFRELDVPYKQTGVIVIARNSEEMERIKAMQEMAKPEWNLECIDRDTLFSLEPNVTQEAIGALYDEGHMFSQYPWDVVIALAENAKKNGIRFLFDAEVQGYSRSKGVQKLETAKGTIKTEYVVNATGPWGPDVAKLADACDFSLQFFKGHSLLTDRRVGNLVKNCIFWPPTPGVSKAIQPMISGNLRLGSIYVETDNKEDAAADQTDMETVLSRASDLVPSLTKDDIIAYYTGMRVFSARDKEEYIIEFAPNNRKFINVVLRLPGFTPGPAIAEKVVSMLGESGLKLDKKEDFNPYRKRIPIFRDLPDDERRELISQDTRWGNVVCRCETVTEAEIVEAIRRGATTLDGVKYRTRASMGRCQGNFCVPRVVELLARELDVPAASISKNSGNSQVLF